MDTSRPRPRRTAGSKAAQLKGQVLQCHLHPARRRQSYIASLSDSEGEKHACAAQADAPQQTGTRSGKSYLRQYEKSTDEIQQQTTSVPIPASTPSPTKGREKPKEVRFDHVLKKPSGQGFDTPFRFDILAQLANIPARITIHELFHLSKETRETLCWRKGH